MCFFLIDLRQTWRTLFVLILVNHIHICIFYIFFQYLYFQLVLSSLFGMK